MQNNNELTGPLIDQTGEIGVLIQDSKMIYNVLPKDIRKSENYNKYSKNTKRCFLRQGLTRCMASGL